MECLRQRSLKKQREYLATEEGRAKARKKTCNYIANGYYQTPVQRAKAASYIKKRRRTDINQWLKDRLRKRLWDCLGGSRGYRSIEITGIPIEGLRQHLESQFSLNMTWENRGQWHIDHIRPWASFDLTKTEQRKQCFHYTNLQPLWAKDNMTKSDKWEDAA